MYGLCLQEIAATKPHDAGALLFFVTGVSYIILQTAISYQVFPFGASMTVIRIRLCIAILATVAFFPSILSQKFKCLPFVRFLVTSVTYC